MKQSIYTLIFSSVLAFCNASFSDDHPNIVVILADDMGYGDVQALSPVSNIATPNLNQLAKDGMAFTDAHSPSAVCTPTRYGLLTGQYCWRTSLKRGVLNGYGAPLIKKERETIAEFLRDAGYQTGIVGKWHLGLEFTRQGKEIDFKGPVTNGPQTHGFDESYIIPASLDFPPYVYIQNGKITDAEIVEQKAQGFPPYLRAGPRSKELKMADCLDDLADQATRFIQKASKSEKPFFLYFPLTAPHKPVLPHPRFKGKSGHGDYGDFVLQVDSTVGKVLRSIDSAGIKENTLVIYTSDNGSFMRRQRDGSKPDHLTEPSTQAFHVFTHQANGPFRGTKADVWEAGHRVPFVARWPKKIQANSKNRKTICLTDLFATVAEIVERPLQKNSAPDSFSLLPLLKGKDWKTPRAPVINHSAAGMFAIRDGKWKLVLGNGSGGRQAPRGKPFQKPYALFNLDLDIGEAQNVIEKHSEIAAKLESQCQAIIKNGRSR